MTDRRATLRLRFATLKVLGDKYRPESAGSILEALPPLAIGYDFKAWPRIRIIYLDD